MNQFEHELLVETTKLSLLQEQMTQLESDLTKQKGKVEHVSLLIVEHNRQKEEMAAMKLKANLERNCVDGES